MRSSNSDCPTMIRLTLLCVIVGIAFAQIDLPWKSLDSLKVTFPYFTGLPTRKTDAINSQWQLNQTAPCVGQWRGLRYIANNDYSFALLFTLNEQLAGIQVGIKTDAPVKEPWEWNADYDLWMLTFYFVDPEKICSGETVVADRVWLKNGASGQYHRFPIVENDITVNSTWKHGGCLIGMGQHYWYNVSRDMNCTDFFPAFLLYNFNGILTGFGVNVAAQAAVTDKPPFGAYWEHPAGISSLYNSGNSLLIGNQVLFLFDEETKPQCLAESKGPTSSIHIYFTNPLVDTCAWQFAVSIIVIVVAAVILFTCTVCCIGCCICCSVCIYRRIEKRKLEKGIDRESSNKALMKKKSSKHIVKEKATHVDIMQDII